MASIFQLFGEIFIDNDKANQNIDDTAKKGEGLGTKLANAGKTVGKAATVITGATVTAATGMFALATKTAGTADEIDKASQRAGMSAEAYQQWGYAAKMSGIDASTIERAMVRQQKLFAEAKTGSSKAGQAYRDLGIDISSISSSEEAFEQVMLKLGDLTDESERNAIANQIFGKSYADLAPLLNEGSEGMNSLRQEVVDLGGVMSNDAVAAGAAFGDNLERVRTAIGGAVNTLGAELIPVMDTVVQLGLDNLPTIQAMFDKLVPMFTEFLEQALPILLDLAMTLLPMIMDILLIILDVLLEAVQLILPPLLEFIKMILPMLMEIIATLLPPLLQLFQAIAPLLMQLISAILPVLINLFVTIIQPLTQLITGVLPPLISLFNGIIPPLTQLLNAVLPVLITLFNTLLEPLMKLLNAILGPLISLFETLIQPLVELLSAVLAPLTALFESLIEPLLELLGPILGPLTEIFGGLAAMLTDTVGVAVGTITDIFDGLKRILGGLIDFVTGVFTGNWEKAWEGVKNIFGGVFDAIAGLFKAPINVIISGMNFFIRGLNKLKIPDWVPKIGGKGISIAEIPLLAKGASRVTGPFISGEEGPELVTPTGGGAHRVIPLTDAERQAYQLGAPAPEIDYKKLAVLIGEAVQRALFAAGPTVSIDGREFGRLVAAHR